MQTKKVFLTSVTLMAIGLPVMADNVTPDIAAGAQSADCDSGVLKTTSGSANFEANWDPNTITLNWYNDDTLLSVQTGAQTCTYDGNITLPTTVPTKQGYTFDHWQVRPLPFCFAGIDASIDGTEYFAHTWHGDFGYNEGCYSSGSNAGADCTDSAISDLGRNEWKVKFSYGTVYGEATCNQISINDWYPGYIKNWYNDPDYEAFISSFDNAIENGTMTEEEALEAAAEILFAPNGPFDQGKIWAQMFALETGMKTHAQVRFIPTGSDVRPTNAFSPLVNDPEIMMSGAIEYPYCECWCRITSFTSATGGTCNTPTSSWLYAGGINLKVDGMYGCAGQCAGEFSRGYTESQGTIGGTYFRHLLYGITQ